MNKTLLLSGFLLGLMLAGLGCGKKDDNPTIPIKGTVIDLKTGEPIEDAFVYSRGVKVQEQGGNVPVSCADRTDTNGHFECIFTGNYSGSDISKDGYVDKTTAFNLNDKENEVVQLVPRDGFLRLLIENNAGLQSPLYVSVYSRTIRIETKQNSYYTGESIKQYPLSIGLQRFSVWKRQGIN